MTNDLLEFEELDVLINKLSNAWRQEYIRISNELDKIAYSNFKEYQEKIWEQAYKFNVLEVLMKNGKINELIDKISNDSSPINFDLSYFKNRSIE